MTTRVYLSLLLAVLSVSASACATTTQDAADSSPQHVPGTTQGVIADIETYQRPDAATQLVGDEGHLMVPEGDAQSQWTYADGVLTASSGWDSVLTPDAYSDFVLHVEFNCNDNEGDNVENDGNSGVYIQQRYEIQIQNAFGISQEDFRASYGGSIYRFKMPDHLVSRPAGQWQTYDIVFRAARFDGDQKTENARVTVYHNGVLIHDDVEMPHKTGAGQPEGPEPRPLKLQGHSNPVQFRNVWVQELELD